MALIHDNKRKKKERNLKYLGVGLEEIIHVDIRYLIQDSCLWSFKFHPMFVWLKGAADAGR